MATLLGNIGSGSGSVVAQQGVAARNANAHLEAITAQLVNPATMNAAEQLAWASKLRPGQELTPGEAQQLIQHEILRYEHRGHENQHALMFLILVAVLALLPGTVRLWRRRHPASYRLVSIGSISLMPPYFAVAYAYYRFVVFWLLYSTANLYILYQATRTPLARKTPRRVYQWFALTNKMFYAVFVLGMVLFLFCFFNIMPGLTDSEAFLSAAVLVLFYGLYFGLLSRDLVQLCSDRIAATLGYAGDEKHLPTKTLPKDVCCVCSEELGAPDMEGLREPRHRLGCGHEFHATCIRGWCVVGKKDMCPFCREKVDLETFKQNPWDKQELFYVTALEYMRFFVSWQPLTVLFLAAVYWVLGLS
ncbi:hypothetical protein GGI07_002328 [Coemansia sp. Benny D115]|nr:hypothetical protein GGI07_002328 [Coemansia sp. Benny D115]